MDCARPLIESLCADAPAKSARAIDRLRVEFPLTPSIRKDVPHRFPNQCRLESMADDLSRVGESIIKNLLPTHFIGYHGPPADGPAQAGANARSTISARSRDRPDAALMRSSAPCALPRRPDSSVRQVRKAVAMRAATCGFLGSSASTMSATKS